MFEIHFSRIGALYWEYLAKYFYVGTKIVVIVANNELRKNQRIIGWHEGLKILRRQISVIVHAKTASKNIK